MDLSAAMFYKVKFAVSAKNPSDDLLWKIVLHIRNWQTAKWNRHGETILTDDIRSWSSIKKGGRIFTDTNIVYIESECFSPDTENAQFWACKISETPPAKRSMAPRTWMTEIGYERGEGNSAIFSCVLSYEDRAGFIGPYQETPGSSIPWLIKNIVQDESLNVAFGSDCITGVAERLNVGDWPTFLSRLKNEHRVLPYIYISPLETDKDSHKTELLINPERLAEVVYGNAMVFYSTDIDFTREMSYMNPEYACYNGAIMVYHPGAKEAIRHHFLGRQEIEDSGEDGILGYLRRAFTQNVHFYDSFFRIEDCRRKKADFERRVRVSTQIAHYKTQILQAQDKAKVQVDQVEAQAFEMLEEEERQREQAEADRDEYKSLYEKEKAKVYNLETLSSQMRAAMLENEGLRRAVDSRTLFSERPCSVESVVRYFEEAFSDRILFSDSAKKSLKNCRIDIDELWRVFYSLSTVMWSLYREGSGDIYSTFKTRTGIDCARGEGAMTRKDRSLMRQYEALVDNEVIDIEAHITYPKQSQSIHFGYSSIQDKLVIGHCGEHLDNYSTRKVK